MDDLREQERAGFKVRRLRRARLALADDEEHLWKWGWSRSPSNLDYLARRIRRRAEKVVRLEARYGVAPTVDLDDYEVEEP